MQELPAWRKSSAAGTDRRRAGDVELWPVSQAAEACVNRDLLRQMGDVEVETLKRGYAALNRGDLSVVLALLDPDIQWHEPAPSPEAGAHRGRDGFERFLRGWLESFEDFRVDPERVVERGDHLVVVVRQSGRGRSSGLHVDARLAHVWTVADGKAVRWEAVADPEEALADGG